MKRPSVFLCAMALVFGVVGTAVATIIDIDSRANIYGAGHPIPPAPVPEPATMLLNFTGLIGFAGFRKKLKKK